ncbi:Eukaryotic translation initiation factor 3 subunit B [Morus notabilis]|uniref:Eukaryotic translation initiation factor 3 subunit B n=1 Tax=Morus notabilis TaxID=981085 RepID=W9S5D8_9ROSA|nr:eukaryotic translation initiation factor 3 subunit B [Morus notabilis]EXC26717.1 Eukaryotic translation initiation factor 3 subunit B [Morus notabilis]
MAEDVEPAEQLKLQLSSMDLNSDHFPIPQNLSAIREERDVFYDDDGLVLDNVGFDNVVVVDNLPLVVREEVVRTLESDVREIFGAVGVIKKDGFSMPVNPQTLETLGHCYIEFTTRQEAELATENMDGYKYGKSILSVALYDDLHRFVGISPELESYIAEKREDDGTENTQSEDEEEDEDEIEGYDTSSISEEEMES